MENKRGSGIFLSVIGVATLVVAIIGATFAYFSATAASGNEAIAVESTELALGYADVITGLKSNMIPSTETVAEYSAFTESWVNKETYTADIDRNGDGDTDDENEKSQQVVGQGQCIDDSGNEVCSFYEFYVGNPSTTTNMEIVGSINVVANGFTNLKFNIYDEEGELVETGEFDLVESGQTAEPINLPGLSQQLIASDADEIAGTDGYDAEKPNTYPVREENGLMNVRHYTMLIWIDEIDDDQTDEDAGKSFAAGITFKTGGASGGVTGMIAAAG